MKFEIIYRNNIKVSLVTEGILFCLVLFLGKWFGKELFDFYIFSAVFCKILGYASIILYPLVKLKSKIYEIKMTGKGFEIFYAVSFIVLFVVQLVLILFKIKFPVAFMFLTSFYEIYTAFLKKGKSFRNNEEDK